MKHMLTILLLLSSTGMQTALAAGDENHYRVDLSPLNASGVYGTVEATLADGKMLHITLTASGLEPGKVHPQHIHGINSPVKNSTCPTIANDTDGDGLVSVREGAATFGPIILALVPFNLVDAAGSLNYQASFTINPGDMQPLHKRAVVIHGATVNGEYIPSLPVACGEIVQVD